MIKLTMSPDSLPPSVDTSMQSMLDFDAEMPCEQRLIENRQYFKTLECDSGHTEWREMQHKQCLHITVCESMKYELNKHMIKLFST